MQNINVITQQCPKILILSHFGTLWACPNMPGHTHQKYEDYFEALIEQQLQAKYQYNNSIMSKDMEFCMQKMI